MFDPTKPIDTTQENIDKIISIKRQIAPQLRWYEWNKDEEFNRLFNIYISQDEDLKNITNN